MCILDDVDDWRVRRKGKTPLIGQSSSDADVKPDVSQLEQAAVSSDDARSSTHSSHRSNASSHKAKTKKKRAGCSNEKEGTPECDGGDTAIAGTDEQSEELRKSLEELRKSRKELSESRDKVSQLEETLKSLRQNAAQLVKILLQGQSCQIRSLEQVDGILVEMVKINTSNGDESTSAATNEAQVSSSKPPQARSRCNSRASSTDSVEIIHVEGWKDKKVKEEPETDNDDQPNNSEKEAQVVLV